MATLAERIKELRTERDLTQEGFGKIFGIVKSTVSLYESNKSTPDDEIKKKIAEYFNVSLDYLMGASEIKNPYLDEEQLSYYKKDIEALEKFRRYMIDKGHDEYKDKTIEDLADSMILADQMQQMLNKNKSN